MGSDPASGDVIVVGGGVAGLTCALALADEGLRVTLLEREAFLGGRARSWRDAATGDSVDIGPHVVHNEYRNFLALLRRLGTHERIHWQPGKLITFATDPPHALKHRALPAPLSLLPDFLRAPGLTMRDMVSNNRVTWRALKFGEEDVPDLDRYAAEDYLREQGLTPRMIDWFWKFASMAVMNVPLERCSAAALLRVHAALIGHRGLHFGFPEVGLSDLYVPQVVQHLESAGNTVSTRAEVVAITPNDLGHTVTLRDGRRHRARHVVIALPPQELGALRPELARVEAFEPSPYISVYLWFDRKLTREKFWALLWSPERLNYDFYDLSNIRPGQSEGASITASNIIYSHRAAGMSDEEIVQATVREVALFAPEAARAKVRHWVVNRIPMVIACPTPGSETKRPETRTSTPGLLLAGDWTRTALPSSMESAACSGYKAAEAILADLGRPKPLAKPPRPTDGLAGMIRRITRVVRRAPM